MLIEYPFLGEVKHEAGPEWFNVVAWSSLAEICKRYLTKGKLIYIEGRLQNRHWENQNGNKHSSTEIVANEMLILDDQQPLKPIHEAEFNDQ